MPAKPARRLLIRRRWRRPWRPRWTTPWPAVQAEFLNRIDEVIRFRPLGVDDLERIVRLQLADLSTLMAEQGLELQVDAAVVRALAELGHEPEYGARPLRRVLRRHLENPLATELLEERFAGATAVKVTAGDAAGDPFRFAAES